MHDMASIVHSQRITHKNRITHHIFAFGIVLKPVYGLVLQGSDKRPFVIFNKDVNRASILVLFFLEYRTVNV